MKMDQIVERCPGILYIPTDLCIYGHSQRVHDTNLLNLMKVASDNSHLYNSKKCQIKHLQITFFGTIFSSEHVRHDPDKI